MWDLKDFWYALLIVWWPTAGALATVLLVNFYIPIRGRLDHALASSIISALAWGGWALVTRKGDVVTQAGCGLILMFIADLIGTLISFTNRLRNAVVTAVVFAAVF